LNPQGDSLKVMVVSREYHEHLNPYFRERVVEASKESDFTSSKFTGAQVIKASSKDSTLLNESQPDFVMDGLARISQKIDSTVNRT
jgi:hypothetical protein